MRSIEYVKNTLSQMGALNLFGTKREVGELPSILHDDEELLYVTSGMLPSSGFFYLSTWLVAATSERVIFLDKGLILGMSQIEISLEKISSIGYSTYLIFGNISVLDGSTPMNIMFCPKWTLKPFVDAVNAAKNQLNKNGPAVRESKDRLAELERLVLLKEKGVLDESEFLEEKRKLMSSALPKAEPKITAAALASAHEQTEAVRVKDRMGYVWGGLILLFFIIGVVSILDDLGLLEGL